MTTEDPYRRRRMIEARPPRETKFSPHTSLGTGIEFDVIRRLLERWGPRARRIGDDGAVITSLGERALVISTDTSVENVHFRGDWLSAEEIGYRATVAALSDLAAMGAKPLGLLAAMIIPEIWRTRLDALGDGIGSAAELAGTPIIGGDLSRGSELSLTITVLGTARDVLFRTTARPGDGVYLTGRLGGCFAALCDFEAGREPEAAHRERFAHPFPRLREALWLSEHGANAAIDISDGLAADVAHLAAASRVVITIDLDHVPRMDGVSPADAARSGEEYELVVTAPDDMDTGAFQQEFNLDLTRIGTVEQGTTGARFNLDGERVEIPAGYLHFDG